MTTRIPLYGHRKVLRGHALLDSEDANRLGHMGWRLTSHGYARRTENGDRVYLHRAVLGLERGDPRQVDHINRDKLDNRRENLRVVGPDANAQNKSAIPGSTSRFRGVSWDERTGRWMAKGTLGRRQFYLGRYRDEEEASRVAAVWRAEHMPYSEEACV